jgi:hypothetical protein
LATSMIGLIEIAAFLLASSCDGLLRFGFRGGVDTLVVMMGLGTVSCVKLGTRADSASGARGLDFDRSVSISRNFLAFTLSCLLCLVTLKASSVPSLTCLASASLSCAIAAGLVCNGGAVLGRKETAF